MKSRKAIRSVCIHLTLAHCKGQGHSHLNSDYLANGYRLGNCYFQQIWCRMCAPDYLDYPTFQKFNLIFETMYRQIFRPCLSINQVCDWAYQSISVCRAFHTCHFATRKNNVFKSFKSDRAVSVWGRHKRENRLVMIFMRNATHCISPIAIVVCVCVCVCMPRLWTPVKRFEIETSFFFWVARNDTGHNL